MALAIYGVTCCAVTVCLSFGFYELMKPARFANPGLAAYKPPHNTVINLVGPAPPVLDGDTSVVQRQKAPATASSWRKPAIAASPLPGSVSFDCDARREEADLRTCGYCFCWIRVRPVGPMAVI